MSAKIDFSGERKKAIKRFLRDRESHKYFKDGNWTDNPREANSYSDVVEVAEICSRYGLKNVELALRFETAECDLFCLRIR